jgi:glycosyltransferase involved in cell wall biosynthesis
VSRRSIVHLTTYLQGGAGRCIADLACAQHRAGHDVLVVTSASGVAGYDNYPDHLQRLRDAGVALLLQDSLFTRNRELNLQALAALRAHRDRASVDVVHAHAAIPAVIGRMFATGEETPGLLREARPTNLDDRRRMGLADAGRDSRRWPGNPTRHPIVIQTQHGWGTSKRPEQARHDLDVLATMDAVIVTSRATGDFLTGAGVPGSLITVIPCGIASQVSGPTPGAAVSHSWGPPSGGPSASALEELLALRDSRRILVGCIGSVTTNKNQALLLRALAQPEARDITAVFIGEGGDALLPQAVTRGVAGRIRVLGYVPDAHLWLPTLHFLVVPSRSEGQGLVVLEAFRARVPVIASSIPALRELVADGETGWLFESDDEQSLGATLARATSADEPTRRRIVDAAEERFRSSYSNEVTIARHAELYEALINRT